MKLTFALLTGMLLCASAGPLKADGTTTIKVPSSAPVFRFELPADWSCTPDKDGDLDCKAGKDETFAFQILSVKEVSNDTEMKAYLPKLLNGVAGGMELKDLAVEEIETNKNGHGVSFMVLAGNGKVGDIEFSLMTRAFEPQKGKFYAILLIAPKNSDPKHKEKFDAMIASIAPIQ